MTAITKDVMCFDVERGLSKALGIKVETFLCGPVEYRFRIGQRWNLAVDEVQLGDLWNDSDNPSVLRDTFNELKASCLAFMTFQR